MFDCDILHVSLVLSRYASIHLTCPKPFVQNDVLWGDGSSGFGLG